MLSWRNARRAVVVVVVAAMVGFLPAAPASAQNPPCDVDWGDDRLQDWINECGLEAIGAGGGGERECVQRGTPYGNLSINCVDQLYGWWSNEFQCYLKALDPQPPAGDESWEGNEPEDGLVYAAACPFLDGVDGLSWTDPELGGGDRFVPHGEGPLGAVVERAIDSLELAGADIHMVPDPAGAGLVFLPVWMWTPETATTWNPEPLELEALGWVLVVEAEVDLIVWDMGDGTEVECTTAGTPYDPGIYPGIVESPDCGHVYEQASRTQPDGRYPVTATTTWNVSWGFEGTDIGATLTTERESSTTVVIDELQVLTGG